MDGPSWIGLGVHRSGTTWFTDLLLQHPEMTLTGMNEEGAGRKELHFFDATLLRNNDEGALRHYRKQFAGRLHAGEFTPDYLRCLWAPPLVQQAAPEALLLVLLRDPVERFESAVRWRVSRQRLARPDERVTHHWIRSRGADALWGGMYATQLAVWTQFIPRERFIVQQYEELKAFPQGAVERVWRALDLDPVPLAQTERPSKTSTPDAELDAFTIDEVPGLRETLEATYRPEVDRLVEGWGIDASMWRSFAGLVGS